MHPILCEIYAAANPFLVSWIHQFFHVAAMQQLSVNSIKIAQPELNQWNRNS
jgi:hypothetical protein